MPLLEIVSLRTHFFAGHTSIKAVDGLSLSVHKNETLALVGESGSGKSVTALSILRLVPPPGRIVGGKIFFKNKDLLGLAAKEMRAIRGREIGLVMQDPLSALNPVIRVGEQVAEVLSCHFGYSNSKARHEALEIMQLVQLTSAEKIYRMYPHELSGGLRQRVILAIALACRPELLIADEPTTALDVTIQSQILALLKNLQKQLNLTLLLITHDLGVVAEIADRVAVMYAGKIVEQAPVERLFSQPLHPYTRLLLSARPQVRFSPGDKPFTFALRQPAAGEVLVAPCDFAGRCPLVEEPCSHIIPEKVSADGRYVRCIK